MLFAWRMATASGWVGGRVAGGVAGRVAGCLADWADG